MSVYHLSAILEAGPELDVTPAQRLVLVCLADHADEAGECYPSLERIAHQTGTTRTETVRLSLRALESAGYIKTIQNGAIDNRIPQNRRPNLYRLILQPRPHAKRGGIPIGPVDNTEGVGNSDPTQKRNRPHASRGSDPTRRGGETTNEPPMNPGGRNRFVDNRGPSPKRPPLLEDLDEVLPTPDEVAPPPPNVVELARRHRKEPIPINPPNPEQDTTE